MDKQTLAERLDELEAALPKMIEDNPDPADFWPEFAGQADVIEDAVVEHCDYFHDRINAMLAKHGMYVAGVDFEGSQT